ncbi:MAG TPA: hypothetical protein VMS17_30675 [Gemmataceae bacterium]|nr:hypothetical protein [Gemmataceae bacterium]
MTAPRHLRRLERLEAAALARRMAAFEALLAIDPGVLRRFKALLVYQGDDPDMLRAKDRAIGAKDRFVQFVARARQEWVRARGW